MRALHMFPCLGQKDLMMQNKDFKTSPPPQKKIFLPQQRNLVTSIQSVLEPQLFSHRW